MADEALEGGGWRVDADVGGASSERAPLRAEAGLCAQCAFARRVASGRGSVFVLCERSRTDARFVRYPRLPVLACVGFETEEIDG
jgi:hypothetical protein